MTISILLPDLRGGGAERVAVNLANELSRRGYSIDMVLLSATGAFLGDLNPQVRVVDLRVKRFRGTLLPLAKYLRRNKPAALLACMWPLTAIAVLARIVSSMRTRVIVAEHTTWSRSELLRRATVGWQVRITMHLAFPQAAGIVAVSRGAADDLAHFARLERNKITVVYNPLVGSDKAAERGMLATADWWNGPHRRLLAVGTLTAIKDYSTLLEAFAQLRQKIRARLLILGEGESRADLEALTRKLGIQKDLFMPGFVKEVAPYFKHAELHVLSSTGEGFGNVIVEALAAGTPVVSTDCPSGPREILCDGRYGRLVPVGDAAALADAMAQSLASTHDREALKARAQDFSIDKATDRYLELLLPSTAHANQ